MIHNENECWNSVSAHRCFVHECSVVSKFPNDQYIRIFAGGIVVVFVQIMTLGIVTAIGCFALTDLNVTFLN